MRDAPHSISEDELRQIVQRMQQDMNVEALSVEERKVLVDQIIDTIRSTWLIDLDMQRREEGRGQT